MLFLFLVTLCVSKTILRETFTGVHDNGWFQIKLATKTNQPHLIKIEWCSELYAGATPDISDCQAHNLVRQIIYPNGTDKAIDMTSSPGVLKIDPNLVSGFWLKRQADVVVEMKDENDKLIVQVVRMNPPKTSKLAEKEEIAEQIRATATPVGNPIKVPSVTWDKTGTNPGQGGDKAFDFNLSFGKGPIILTGLALAAMFFVIGLALLRSKPDKSHDPKILSEVYKFESNSGIDLLTEDENDFNQVEKDKAFLLSLSKSPNEAYFLNAQK
jgi:hypothetical protein